MARAKFTNVDKAMAWARSVLKGKFPACRYIHQAIERHFDDVAASRSKGYPYKFDPAKAEKKLRLMQLLPHTKGEWAFKRQLITLEPWQLFGLACTFGWVRKKGGYRRFLESYWEVPRKNGKSVIAAGVGISMFTADNEFGAEVYSGATTEKQAWEVFRPARLMVSRSPMLIEAAGIEVNASNLNIPSNGSRFEPLIGNPGDGASPSCAIIDEFHEHDTAAQYDTMLTGNPAHINWFNVPEVGASSSGSAGLELTLGTNLTRSSNATAYQFNGSSISVPVGSGLFPSDWTSGIIIRVVAPYTYTVVDGGAGRDIVRGPLEMLNPTVGMLIEVAGSNAGMYVVNSYTPYSPAIPASPGSASTLTGSAAPTRYDFNVTPLTFTLSRGTTNYSVTLNTATTNLAGLVSALNTQLSATPIRAEESSGRVRFLEQSPFAGQAISSSGASTILGASPVGVTGTATTSGSPEQLAEMTLNYDGGAPVVGLTIGQGLASIGPRGLRYRITAFSTTLMTVERLTSSGSTDTGWPGFNAMQTVNGIISLDVTNLTGGYRGPFACCPEGEKVTELEWSVFFANGLCGLGREGQIYGMAAYHTLEYRDMDAAGAWTTLTKVSTGGSLDAQGFTYRATLPYPMRAEARVRREASYSNEARDDITWYDMRGRMQNSPTSYPGLTVIALDIRGGDRLSAQSESQVSLEATRILPLFSGGVWLPKGPTRDIVPWCLAQLKARGYTDDDFDLPEWAAFHATCAARGDTYDQTLDSSITVKEMVNNALACGFGELVVFNGLLRPARDEKRSVFSVEYGPKTQTYSPQNMTKMLKINGAMPSINDFDGVDVEYFSSSTWAWETVECRWPGDEGLKVERVKVVGFSGETRAWRFGMRRRGHQKYRTDVYSWETEMDGRNSGYLTFAAVADDTPKRCQSSILLDFAVTGTGALLRSSEPLDWSAGGEHRLGVRKLDGTLAGPFTAIRIDDYTAQVDDLGFTPVVEGPLEPPHILFGPASRWAYPALITSSDPANGNVAVKAMPYDERVYTYDDQFPPA